MAELAGKKEKSSGSRTAASGNAAGAPKEPGAAQQVGVGGLGSSTGDRGLGVTASARAGYVEDEELSFTPFPPQMHVRH